MSDNAASEECENDENIKEKTEHICELNESETINSVPNPRGEESGKAKKLKHVCDNSDGPHVDKNVNLEQDADSFKNIGEQEVMDIRKPGLVNTEATPGINIGGQASTGLLVRARDSSSVSNSPSRSPSYVRKPLPINEPKPVLPKSKHLKNDAGPSSCGGAIIRASVIEEEHSSGESIEKLKCSDGLKKNLIKTEDIQATSTKSDSTNDTHKKPSVSNKKTCPLSPRLTPRNRPSTLFLDKKERVKRSSAVSATPSTDSSIMEYDSETREKVLAAAIKVEDDFLEWSKSLNLEPDPIIEAGKARGKKQVQLSNGKPFSDSKHLKPQTPIASVGQENLDSLCRMMEEILMLRDENYKLQERLEYMEVSPRIPQSLGSLERMPRPPDLPPSGLSTWLAEENARNKRCKSVGTESQVSDRMPKLEEVSSPRTKAKLSKWSKVKEAFKWERSPSEPLPSTMTTFDESTSSQMKHKFEKMISSSSEELPSEIYNFDDRPYDIYLPRSSSVSDCYNNEGEIKNLHDKPRRHSLTTFDEKIESHEEYDEDGKANQSTWYKVKNMIYTRRESLKKKTNNKRESVERSKHDTDPTSMPLSTASDYEFIEEICDIDTSPTEELSSSRTRNDSVTQNIQLGEKSKQKKMKRQTPPELVLSNHEFLDDARVYSHSLSPLNCSNEQGNLASKKFYLSPKHEGEETSHSLPSSPNKNSDVFFYDDHILLEASKNNQEFQGADYRDVASYETLDADNEIQRNYEQLKRSLSEEFNKKMNTWGQKKCSRDSSDGRTIDSNKHLSAEFRKKLDEWQKRKRTIEDENEFPEQRVSKDKGSLSGAKQTPKSNKIRARPAEQKTLQEDDLKPEFKLKVAEWEVRKAMAGHSNKTTEEITKLMPEDFNKKLKEWEQIKEGKPNPRLTPDVDQKAKKKRKPQEKWVRGGGRKFKEDNMEMTAPEVGTFAWLDKELMKVEREKQRLERERSKFDERQARLTAMREALCHQPKKEITVKTAAGEEFKFEGINQKFTKKLYEWESRRGIAPESSTITLLQSGISQNKDQRGHGAKNIQSEGEPRSRSAGRLTEQLDNASSSTEMETPTTGHACRRVVSVTRTDSVKTQSSLLLLEEKMSLLADLQEKADKCRLLESQLDTLGNKMNSVAKSRAELAQLKEEEVSTVESSDSALLGHLDRKLGSLEQEQTDLMGASYDIKASLTVQSEAQASLTEQLISKIGAFNYTHKGTLGREELGSGSLRNIHNLSLELESHARNLEKILHERNVEIAALKSRLTSEVNDPESLDLIGTPPPKIPSPIFSEIPLDLLETIFLLKQELTTLAGQEATSTKDDEVEKRQKFSKQKSFSDSDLNSCEEYFSPKRLLSGYASHDSQLASLASSTSMSHYGSETAMDLYRAEQILSSHSSNICLTAEMAEEASFGSGEEQDILWDSRDQFRNKKKLGKRHEIKCKSDGSKKSRRTSSDNVSTPASNRSRSQSIMSTGDEQDEVLVDDDLIQDTGKSEIDKIFEMVHELKKKDLDEYKRKIHLKNNALKEDEQKHQDISTKDSIIEDVPDENNDNKMDCVINETITEDISLSFEKIEAPKESDKNSKEESIEGILKKTPNKPVVANLCNANPANLGIEPPRYLDLDAVLVPTKKTRILPSNEAPRLTTDIQSLVIKTTPCRIFGPVPQLPLPPSTIQLPQTIKRNSIVPPPLGPNSSWPPALMSTSPSDSSFVASTVIPPSCPTTNSAKATQEYPTLHSISPTKNVAGENVCEEDQTKILKTEADRKSAMAASEGSSMKKSEDQDEQGLDNVQIIGLKHVEKQTPTITFETEEDQNTEKEDHKVRNEGVKKFNTKFRGHNLQIPPEAEITEGLEESTITAGKSPSSGNQTPKQLLSLPTLSRNPATSKQSHDDNMTPDKKVRGLSTKSSFHLPPLDPAVEIICRDWRSNSPATPATPGKDNKLASAWQARSRRIKQTNEARQEFLCNGPGGLAAQKTFIKTPEKSVEANDEITVETKDNPEDHDDNECLIVHGSLKLGMASNTKINRSTSQNEQSGEQRSFAVEKSFSSDLVSGLSGSLAERKMSKSSLFTRLRKRQLGSKGKIGVGTPDHRLSLALTDSVPTTAQDTVLSGNVSRQGSHSCPSSPSLSSKRRTKGWKNVFKGKTSR